MWMLIATICVQTSLTEAACPKYRRPAASTLSECREMIDPIKQVTLDNIESKKWKLLFMSVTCQRGKDT